jgi:hypothetical protein
MDSLRLWIRVFNGAAAEGTKTRRIAEYVAFKSNAAAQREHRRGIAYNGRLGDCP